MRRFVLDELRKKAGALLEAGDVRVVIGYGEGTGDRARAIFVREPERTDDLIFDGRCKQNLAIYLTRREVKGLGKPAIVATLPALKAVLQLAGEFQIAEGELVVLAPGADGSLHEFKSFADIEKYLAAAVQEIDPAEQAEMDRVRAMSTDERWKYWQGQISRCIKCYACRQACPMCYCARCTVECNQPQWIPVPSHELGNLEWNVMRAMHLAGRCVDCGDCSRACPVGIPLYLLNRVLIGDIESNFHQRAGMKAEVDYALSTFHPDDKENFIR